MFNEKRLILGKFGACASSRYQALFPSQKGPGTRLWKEPDNTGSHHESGPQKMGGGGSGTMMCGQHISAGPLGKSGGVLPQEILKKLVL